jgi:hypothetical protein
MNLIKKSKLLIVLLSVLLVSISGCGVVTAEDYKQAEIKCKSFGGVGVVWLRGTEVRCKDGTKIEIAN